MIKNKKFLLGITGSIAASKCIDLAKQIMAQGGSVKTVFTESAKSFVSPLALKAFTNDEVFCNHDFFSNTDPMLHIKLARYADFILIAPATANFIAKLANGFADDLLSSICVATDSPIIIAPAMNHLMWNNPFVQANIQKLEAANIRLLLPNEGMQACGEYGVGRMMEPHQIVAELDKLSIPPILKGKRILITAGATIEKIDPVRYISNFSSGKMGYALAKMAKLMGAEVCLISGATMLSPPAGVETYRVESANDMYKEVMNKVKHADIFIGCAAVADYRMPDISAQKHKKSGKPLMLKLEPTPDIISTVANLSKRPYVVGFAAETQNLIDYANRKLKSKKLDMIVANDVGENKVFGQDTIEGYILTPNSKQPIFLKRNNKLEIACQILTMIKKSLNKKK